MRKLILALVPILVLTLVPAAGQAGTVIGADRRNVSKLPLEWFRKLGTGVSNIALSPLEIAFGWGNETNNALYEDRDPIVGGFSGAVTGVGFTLARAGVGVFEVVTFPFRFGFEPLMEPETQWHLKFGRD